MSSKSLPKSLHTVTVLVQVARLAYISSGNLTVAMDMALDTLGYSRESDPYGLIDKAEKQLRELYKARAIAERAELERAAMEELAARRRTRAMETLHEELRAEMEAGR